MVARIARHKQLKNKNKKIALPVVMVITPFARARILKSLKKANIVKISGKLFFHSKVEYPKLQIPRKKKTPPPYLLN